MNGIEFFFFSIGFITCCGTGAAFAAIVLKLGCQFLYERLRKTRDFIRFWHIVARLHRRNKARAARMRKLTDE